ncbi:MAG: hypothetical protein CMK59_05860 [Proteobacteria bacterium]|nr:hypothetical protein [Pseudomonadota bacterium]
MYSYLSPIVNPLHDVLIGILIICICLAFAITLMLPILFFRFGEKRKVINLAPVYGIALRFSFWISLISSTIFALAFFLTDLSTTSLKPSWHDRLVKATYYPFADLLNLQSSSSVLNSVQIVSVFYTLSILSLGIIILAVAYFVAQNNSYLDKHNQKNILGQWGHVENIQTNVRSAAPWMRSLGWNSVWVLSFILLLVFVFKIPLFSSKGELQIPMFVWTFCVLQTTFLIGVLLAQSQSTHIKEKKSTVRDIPQKTRRMWETSMADEGVSLLRLKYVNECSSIEFAPLEDYNESSFLQPRNKTDDPQIDAPNLLSKEALYDTKEYFKYIIPQRTTSSNNQVNKTNLWKHQMDFCSSIVNSYLKDLKDTSPSAWLLHTYKNSGKTTAVFETACTLAQVYGKNTIILYPDKDALNKAESLYKQNKQASESILIYTSDNYHPVKDTAQIILATADWIPQKVLPEYTEYEYFLTDLGLVVLEDVESMSGIQATTFSITIRRFFRILQSLQVFRTQIGVTVCCNPSENSGVEEYVRALVAPLELRSALERNDSPSLDVHVYLLEYIENRKKDAQNINLLPEMAQLALTSRAWGAPTKIELFDTQSVKEDDLVPPHWLFDYAKEHDTLYIDDLSQTKSEAWNIGFASSSQEAWVRLIETPLQNILSAVELYQTGGIALLDKVEANKIEKVHMVVLYPSFLYRGLIRYLMELWVQTHHDEKSVWNQFFRPKGTRLVCGYPSAALLRQHIQAALSEKEGKKSEILNMFPHSDIVTSTINKLQNQTILRVKMVRRLEDKEGGNPIETEELSVNRKVITDLESFEDHKIEITLVGRSEPLQLISFRHACRQIYPGMLFYLNGYRFRIDEALAETFFINWHKERTKLLMGESPHRLHIVASADDSHSFTFPIWKRQFLKFYGLNQSSLHELNNYVCTSNLNDGFDIHRWRGALECTEQFLGRYEVEILNSKEEYTHKHRVNKNNSVYQWQLQMQGLFMAFVDVNEGDETAETETETETAETETETAEAEEKAYLLSHHTAVTLRRMLRIAIHALMQIEEHVIDIAVLSDINHFEPKAFDSYVKGHISPSFENYFQQKEGNPIQQIFSKQTKYVGIPFVIILDPLNGDSGIIESLGSSRWEFVNTLFEFTWKWATDLSPKASWDDIGYLGLQEQDEEYKHPNVQGVSEFLSKVIGTQRLKQIKDLCKP